MNIYSIIDFSYYGRKTISTLITREIFIDDILKSSEKEKENNRIEREKMIKHQENQKRYRNKLKSLKADS